MTGVGLFSTAAAIAVAKLEAAAVGVRPQRADEGTQVGAYVVSEKDALILDTGEGRGLHTNTHTHTHTNTHTQTHNTQI